MAMIYAMSDIHGYYDLMVENLKLIDLEDKENKLIFCGDYIDGTVEESGSIPLLIYDSLKDEYIY
jgi:predicted phosphodiesterase